MHPNGIEAMTTAMREFVEAFHARHPTPEPAVPFPAHLLENAAFSQEDADKTHFADGDRYVDFPDMIMAESNAFRAHRERMGQAPRIPWHLPEGYREAPKATACRLP